MGDLGAVVGDMLASSLEAGGYRVGLAESRCNPELHGDVPRFERAEIRHDVRLHGAARADGGGLDQRHGSRAMRCGGARERS